MGKKWIALFLAVLMLFSLSTAAFAAEGDEEEEEVEIPAELIRQMGYSVAEAITKGVNPDEIVHYDHLTVGNPTVMKGDFFTDLWGNSTSDIDVRDLLHGLNLIRWDGKNGMFTTDPSVVADITVTESTQGATTGDRTYTMVLRNDLRYSDGSIITARDYAFYFLLLLSQEVEGAGAERKQMDYIVGAEDYFAGRTDVLSGVRVLTNNSISITLDADFLPFFYEMGLLFCNPYPISVIAPGVTVRDDGDGVYLDGVFTSDVLNRTLNDPATGYRTHPSVVSGPYTLKSFDGVTAEFESNPYYPGNADGELPLIPYLTYTLADNETMMDKLSSGEFDLLNKVLRADTITQGLQQMVAGGISMSNYPRTGLSYVAFACEKPAVSSQAVRQAIAYCMDRDALTEAYSGGFGIRVDGYYGIGQWMYGLVNGTIAPPVDPPENPGDPVAQAEYEKKLKEWEELSLDGLNDYAVDTAKAAQLLAADGWAKNADGILTKWVNWEQTTLSLTMAYPEGNKIADYFEEYVIPNLKEVGIELTLKPVAMKDIWAIAYADGDRDVDMFYHPSNFDLLFDAAPYFSVQNGNTGAWNFSRQTDAELYRRALAMRETEPGDVLGYMQKWVSFQERVNEQLPIIPIYGNVYFDFYTDQLHDYDIEQSVTWGEAILGAVKADIPVIETEEEAAEGEEEMEIAG